jgi:hypothetical protein
VYTVDSHIQNITKCKHDFSCLTKRKCGNRDICDVEYVAAEKIIFLNDKEYSPCKNRMPFGLCQTCKCPTRFEIHRKYGH